MTLFSVIHAVHASETAELELMRCQKNFLKTTTTSYIVFWPCPMVCSVICREINWTSLAQDARISMCR